MKKTVIVKGPFYTRSGYGEHARFVLRSLREYEDRFDIYAIAIPWGRTGWVWEEDEETEWIDSIIHKTQNAAATRQIPTPFDFSVQVTIPAEFERVAVCDIGVTAGVETTKMSAQWVAKCNEMSKVITISSFSAQVIENTVREVNTPAGPQEIRVTTPVEVVHFPAGVVEPEPISLDGVETETNFLSLCLWGPRKNLDNTIAWFVEQFHEREDVGLLLKVSTVNNSYYDKLQTKGRLRSILNSYPARKCKVYLLHGDLTDGEVIGLVEHEKVDCVLNLAHGEGFGLPMFYAMQAAKPVIAPDWSGHLDYLYFTEEKTRKRKNGKKRTIKKRVPGFLPVDTDLARVPPQAVWQGVIEPDSMWCYPREESAKEAMESFVADKERYVELATSLRDARLEEFGSFAMMARMADAIWEPSEVEQQALDKMSEAEEVEVL